MNISSISAPTPVNLPDPSASKTPVVQPGQGMRINQLA
jgi:hypothetical protein